MFTDERVGYVATKPINELLPVEALALVNRWAKLKSYFFYDDRDALYALKDREIAKMFKAGNLIAVKVIARESDAIKHMKAAVANSGRDLDFMGYPNAIDFLDKEEEVHYRLLADLVSGCGIDVEYPEDIYQLWIDRLQPELEAYRIAQAEYDTEKNRRKPILDQYQKDLDDWNKAKQEAAKQWAQEKDLALKHSKSGKSLKKDWLERLEKQGFCFEVPKPVYPFPNQLVCPKKPAYPSKTYNIESFEQYVPGSIEAVESAIAWAKEIYGDRFPTEYHKIDDDFICCELDSAICELELDAMREQAIEIFQQVINGDLVEPKLIWDKLTDINLDYQNAIGMKCHFDRRNWDRYSHADYGEWHKINLSPTGHWLLEFQSTEIADITFHVPYDRIPSLKLGFNVDIMPRVEAENKMGREISIQEQNDYPLPELLAILGSSASDFPHGLQNYSEVNYRYRPYKCWDDHEDWITEDDEDELFEVGY